MKQRFIKVGYTIIGLWMFWPIMPVIFAGIIATICGCKLDEGNPHPCYFFGRDIGELLYCLSMFGWFAIGTFPTGLIAMAVFWVVVRKHKRTADSDQDVPEEDVHSMRQDLVFLLGLASLLFSFVTAIPALIIAFRARPLEIRGKIGAAAAVFIVVSSVVFPVALRLLRAPN